MELPHHSLRFSHPGSARRASPCRLNLSLVFVSRRPQVLISIACALAELIPGTDDNITVPLVGAILATIFL